MWLSVKTPSKYRARNAAARKSFAPPEEMASSATAVKEVSLKDAQKLPAGSVLMFKFGTSPAMLIHHADGTWASLSAPQNAAPTSRYAAA